MALRRHLSLLNKKKVWERCAKVARMMGAEVWKRRMKMLCRESRRTTVFIEIVGLLS
jgi:hypothetical protein